MNVRRWSWLTLIGNDRFALKIVALAVALVLWATMLGRKDITVVHRMSLQFLINPSLELHSPRQREVEVEVAGTRMALKRFNAVAPVFPVDLGELGPGNHNVRLDAGTLNLPVGLKVVGIRPQMLALSLRRSSERHAQ